VAAAPRSLGAWQLALEWLRLGLVAVPVIDFPACTR
jgi:hypothetical protein